MTQTHPLYVVSFRDPISRFISFYDYMMRSVAIYYRNYAQQWWKDTSLQHVMDEYFRKIDRGLDPTVPMNGNVEFRTIFRMLHEQVSFLCGFECQKVFAGLPIEKSHEYQDTKVSWCMCRC